MTETYWERECGVNCFEQHPKWVAWVVTYAGVLFVAVLVLPIFLLTLPLWLVPEHGRERR